MISQSHSCIFFAFESVSFTDCPCSAMYVTGARHWPEVNGQYVIQSCKFNGRVTYKHETRDLYFYYIDQQVNTFKYLSYEKNYFELGNKT